MNSVLFLFFFSVCTVITHGRVCYDTGCDLHSWAQVGCEARGAVETGRRWCNGGTIYSCCEKLAEEGGGGGGGGGDGGGSIDGITFDQFVLGITSSSSEFSAPSLEQFEAFQDGLPKGLISTKQEAAMALAHFLQESDGLKAKREYACLVDGCPWGYKTWQFPCDVPGQNYFGRGYIQLSYCYNYKPASEYLFKDDRLVRNPDLVAQDEQTAWDTAFWFWKERVHDKPGVAEGRFGVTTRAINGGEECDGPHKNKARRRFGFYNNIRSAFGLPGQGIENGCYN